MSFFKYHGETRYYPTLALDVSEGQVADFGAATPPDDGHWVTDPGPATVFPHSGGSQVVVSSPAPARSGLAAARPSVGAYGEGTWYSTDTDSLDYSDGFTWRTGVTRTAAGGTYGLAPRNYPRPPDPALPVQRWVKSYKPTSLTSVVVPFDGSSADVDSNLTLTFVCPPSGVVRWRFTAGGIASGGTALQWSIRMNGTRIGQADTVVITGPGTGDSPAATYSVSGLLSFDNTQTTPLVPGKSYTVTWAHRATAASQFAYTRFGGAAGHAVMEIEAVVIDPLVTPYTAAVAATGYIPEWLCSDRQTLLGNVTGPEAKYVCWSTDDGATWTQHSFKFPAGVSHIRQMDNGELLVFVEAPLSGGTNCSIWVSSGFATNKATATFTQKVAASPSSTATWLTWSMDTYGPLAIACEYGPKNGPGDMASKVYLSQDYGQSWTTVFDLTTHFPVAGAHLHGAHYDPWWDALWVTSGDNAAYARVWLSLDHGATWREIAFTDTASHQFTTVVSLPDCILFVTDMGGPSGVYRVPRVHPNVLVWELAYTIDPTSNLSVYGDGAFRLRSLKDAPLLLSIQSGDVADSGRLLITHDGYTFREVWKDTGFTYLNAGLRECFGPTLSGKYIGRVDRDPTSLPANALQLTLTPAP